MLTPSLQTMMRALMLLHIVLAVAGGILFYDLYGIPINKPTKEILLIIATVGTYATIAMLWSYQGRQYYLNRKLASVDTT